MTYTVKTIDCNGYLGRENHPEVSDLGKTVTPIALSIEVYADLAPLATTADEVAKLARDGYTSDRVSVSADEIRRALAGETVTLDVRDEGEPLDLYVVRYFRCLVVETGAVLDLVDFELGL